MVSAFRVCPDTASSAQGAERGLCEWERLGGSHSVGGTVAAGAGPPLTPGAPTPQVSANGNVLRSEIVGSIKMRVFLSGMPELRLGLNDKVLFDNTGREYPTQAREHPPEW